MPETRYARTADGTHVAYQVSGSGAIDLIFLRAWMGNIETEWDDPVVARMLRRFESIGRLLRLDRRGMGMSDRITHGPPPSIEERLDDIRAVMDAADSSRAVFVVLGYASAVVAAFAATYPERTHGVVMFNPIVRDRATADYPWANDEEEFQTFLQGIRTTWGTVERAAWLMAQSGPSRARDLRFVEWWADQERRMGSPDDAAALVQLQRDTDVSAVLPAIHVPTLILIREGSVVERSRYVADRIPGAVLHVLPGDDLMAISGDTDRVVREVEEFVDGLRDQPSGVDFDRVLSTLLFTDVVGSTAMASRLGDRAWAQVLESHLSRATRLVHSFRGRVVDTAGDGMLASFDGTGRAIRCARAVVDDAAELGLKLRAGLHTGECEIAGSGIRGVAVHIGARVAALAQPSEVLVSGTVKDLVAGAGIEFADRGTHELKGVPGEWRLYSVVVDSIGSAS
jgi:class 3 adenylate cyclase